MLSQNIINLGMQAANRVWGIANIKRLTLEAKVSYHHEQHKRKTQLDYDSYSSATAYVDDMIDYIKNEYNSLTYAEQQMDKSLPRMYKFINDPDGLSFARAKYEDMYNNH